MTTLVEFIASKFRKKRIPVVCSQLTVGCRVLRLVEPNEGKYGTVVQQEIDGFRGWTWWYVIYDDDGETYPCLERNIKVVSQYETITGDPRVEGSL